MSCARGASSREHCRILQRRSSPRWEDGIFLGVSDQSDELYVGTVRGMHKVRTLRRREPTEQGDLTFLHAVSARPWDGLSVKNVRVVLPDVSTCGDGTGSNGKDPTSLHQQS